jgi:hypothetical protein
MAEDENPGALADELERTADALEEKGEKVEKDIAQARTDVERKQADGSLPGAQPLDEGPTAEDPGADA